ncbi:vesicle transport protein SEC20 [Chironomus tepperi]|uniref:vesicle transport protein SEC20 n=1 Tax=Chironomus tepperi TaxID=113505 RepID=UPI00391EE2F2
MDSQKLIKQEIVDHNLQVKAIIQDILSFKGSLQDLELLNEAGRTKLAQLRKCIEKLDDWAKDENDITLSNEVDAYREQFSKTLQAFRKANISTMLEIEKGEKAELFTMKPESELRQRFGTSGLISQQETVTDRMLSISRNLAETTQKSANTLESLIQSSTTVSGTGEELHNTAGTIQQSGKLLNKYGRRETTDKILLFLAFMFFLAVVFYIVQKRLF